MNWEDQLNSMIESGHLDPDSISDLWIAYAAETGDESLIGADISCVFTLYRRADGLGYVDHWHRHWRTCSYSKHRSHSLGTSSRCSGRSVSSTRAYSIHLSSAFALTGSAAYTKLRLAMDGSVSIHRRPQYA